MDGDSSDAESTSEVDEGSSSSEAGKTQWPAWKVLVPALLLVLASLLTSAWQLPMQRGHLMAQLLPGLLSLCFAMAFLSFWWQADGLVGPKGIFPIADQGMPKVQAVEKAASREFLFRAWMLRLIGLLLHMAHPRPGLRLCLPGLLASAGSFGLATLQLLRYALAQQPQLPSFSAGQFFLMILQCLLYRSLFYAGQDFMALQWDALLHEMGFWTAALALHPLLPLVALRLMAVKVFLLAAACKLLAEDPLWRRLRALDFHFETQPLPSCFGATLHGLFRCCPCLSKMICAMTIAVEFMVPLLSFGVHRYCRFAAFALASALMMIIALTGNFGFFNFLTAVLAVAFLGDDVLLWTSSWSSKGIAFLNQTFVFNATNDTNVSSGNVSALPVPGNESALPLPGNVSAVPLPGLLPVMSVTDSTAARQLIQKYVQTQQPLGDLVFEIVVVVFLSLLLLCYAAETTMLLMEGFSKGESSQVAIPWRPWMRTMGFCQSYGLFGSVEQVRRELVILELRQGQWRELQWRYKPGDVTLPLSCCSFHMPRLDWLLWLAAIRIGCEKSLELQRELQLRPMAAAPDWLVIFLERLMEERDPSLLALLNEQEPSPPEAVKVELHHYELVGSCCCRKESDEGQLSVTWRRRKLFDVTA